LLNKHKSLVLLLLVHVVKRERERERERESGEGEREINSSMFKQRLSAFEWAMCLFNGSGGLLFGL